MPDFAALLRGINVGGNRKMPMAELRSLCSAIGLENPLTYIQSGNIVFSANGDPDDHRAALETAIEKKFGFAVPVIVRSAAQWQAYIATNPFANDAEISPKTLHLLVASAAPTPAAVEALSAKAGPNERIRRIDDVIWIDYADGVGRSKLTPKLIDAAFGTPATARNLNTVLKLQDMLGDRSQ